MEREEIGLLAACYLMQRLAEHSPVTHAFPPGWNNVGAVPGLLGYPREAAERYFTKWQDRGWLDDRSLDLYQCQLTSGGHIAAKTLLMYKEYRTV